MCCAQHSPEVKQVHSTNRDTDWEAACHKVSHRCIFSLSATPDKQTQLPKAFRLSSPAIKIVAHSAMHRLNITASFTNSIAKSLMVQVALLSVELVLLLLT